MTSQREVSNETNHTRKRKMTTKHNRNMNNEANESQTPSPPPQRGPPPSTTTTTATATNPNSSSSGNPRPSNDRTASITNDSQIADLRVSESVTSDQYHDSHSQSLQLSYYRSLSATPPSPTTTQKRQKLSRIGDSGGCGDPGFNSNFQLPNDILKNLTPVMKSPPRDKLAPNLRKQELLQKIRLKLLEKSSRISKKIIELQRKRQLSQKYKSKKLNDELDQANLRRNKYLNLVRQRAARFYKEVEISETSTKSFTLQQTTPNKPKGDAAATNPCLPPGFDEELIRPVQKLAARFLFYKYLHIIRKSQFLDTFHTLSFNQVLQISNTNSEIRTGITFILKYLQVPHLLGQEYKSFFYCFIMIVDFNDCMNYDRHQGSSNTGYQHHHHHPGFNVNTKSDDEQELFYNNCIWLMVYKYGQYVINEFRRIVHEDVSQVSPSFLKYWDEYNFVFKVFKWNHYKNLKCLLVDSINIVNKQIKALNHLNDDSVIADLGDQHKKLNDELVLLNRYQLDELRNFNSSSEVESFVNAFNSHVTDVCLSSPQNHRDPYIQNKSTFICYNNIKFYIPNVFPVANWRKYWFYRFLQLESDRNNDSYKFPTKIKSGHFYNPPEGYHDDDEVDVQDIMEVNYKSIPIKETYNNLLNFYLDFTSSYYEIKEDEIIVSDESDLAFLQNMQHLVQHHELTSGAINYNNVLLELIGKCISDLNSPFYNQSIGELNEFIYKLFIKKCQFTSSNFNLFRNFENLYVLLNNCQNFSSLKFNIHTFNPSLIFPQFYQFVVLKHHELNLNQCKSIISSSLRTSISRVITPSYSSSSCRFYTDVFLDEIISGNVTAHEISEIYASAFQDYHTRLQHLININCLGVMYEYFQGEKLPNLYEIFHNFDKRNTCITNYQFISYYDNNRDQIEKVLLDKVRSILIGRNDSKVCHVFKYYQEETIQLMNEILSYLAFIYKLYNPILNWIYFELGREDEN
ncbi:hypothetical protein Cantr_10548 [Candida viswanathii]|uniref:Uncharacterized protein n=1 Tax=Candida viswanathii TaxID=5486 RepID=A0A367YEL2_9ASCO|nr:hypothetical protein Cantr_10548 [Candida viswanathii]